MWPRRSLDLKEQPGKDLTVMGSGELIQTLMRHALIDEYLLLDSPARARGRDAGCSPTVAPRLLSSR